MSRIKHNKIGYLYIAPALLFVVIFVAYPLIQLLQISLTNESLLGGGHYVGLKNYVKAFGDRKFWRAFWFTLEYTAYMTPILIMLGFALALLVSINKPLIQFTRAVIFIPVVIGLGSSSLLWFWLFDQQVGLFNRVLVDMGFIDQPMVWFGKAGLGQLAVVISVSWKVIGFGMILMVGAIQGISKEVLEAATIDGATYWQRVYKIILPLSMKTILLVTLISAIGSMLAFDQFYIMTRGAPRGQTFTSMYWVYQNSFVYFKLGYGSALSVLLMLVIMAGTSMQLFLSRRSS